MGLRLSACWNFGFESRWGSWIFVSCECGVLSGRGICDKLITHPEETYSLWWIIMRDLETSRMRRPQLSLSCSAIGPKTWNFIEFHLVGVTVFHEDGWMDRHEEANTFHSCLVKVPINPYPTAFPYGNGMVLHFYQQQESSTTKTVHKVINKGLKTYV